MVLEKMLVGLEERRAKLRALALAIAKMGSVDEGGHVDRLIARFDKALVELLQEIERGEKNAKEWFGEKEERK